MIMKFIENIGDKTINFISSLYYFLLFSIVCTIHIFDYRSYNSKMLITLISQIYHTSIAVLPFFLITAFIFGSALIGALIVIAIEYSIQVQIGSVIVTFVINEFSPLFTAIFISLRSGTLINKKLASVDIENEVDLIDNIILPRIISGILSTVSLSLVFAIIMIGSGYVFTFFLMGMDLHTYKYLIFDAIEVKNIIILLSKGLIFGFIIMVIPIYNGLEVAKENISSKISIIKVIVNIFLALFFIEMLSLLLIKLT